MSDQQDTGRTPRPADVVVGSASNWDTPPSYAGQPMEQSRGTEQRQGDAGSKMSDAKEKASHMADQAGGAMESAKEKAGQATDRASSSIDTGKDKAASGLDTLADTIRDRGEAMGGGSTQSFATTAADKLEAGAQMLREKDTDQMVSDLEALVRRKPIESVLVAAGIGFVLSKIVR